MPEKHSHTISSLRKRDWIVLTAFIAAVAAGYWIYREWIGPEVGLRRVEGNMKSNLPLRIDPNKTLVDVSTRETTAVIGMWSTTRTSLTLKGQRSRYRMAFVPTLKICAR